MKVGLLRVGIDMAAGGLYGPLLDGGGFVFMPIPYGHAGCTYGRCPWNEQHGGNPYVCWNSDVPPLNVPPFVNYFPLVNFFSPRRRAKMRDRVCHCDPEFTTWTYGDLLTSRNRAGVHNLTNGDMLVFYCGLQRWDPIHRFIGEKLLYLIGYFEIEYAGTICELEGMGINWQEVFQNNAHVRDHELLQEEHKNLILVKGKRCSRRFVKAQQLTEGTNGRGPWRRLLPQMRRLFGRERVGRGLQWIPADHVKGAAAYVRDFLGTAYPFLPPRPS